ncbi:LysM peptidoglycan-binding domain-containing protein [Actinomyces sp.]|uniref:LysM peptidoglycan-binding domain-containing protein n=1 Tax=Actinomyces sp. TaxID=29317 RepID=UPI0026DB2055|nr:hypothetical protein [Actinomyces sp.]MDO4899415.1 hypothetical protein [Actinomyces sp.]
MSVSSGQASAVSGLYRRMALIGVGLVCAALSTVLAALAAYNVGRLLELPPAWWGTSQLTAAITGIACSAGAAGALWHVVSVILALVASSGVGRSTVTGRRTAPGANTANRMLHRWGAPLVRRIAAGAVVAGITAGPAFAAIEPDTDDLGWQPTVTASAEPGAADDNRSAPTSEQALNPTSEATGTVPDQAAPTAADPVAPRQDSAFPTPDSEVGPPLLPGAGQPETELIGPLLPPSRPSGKGTPAAADGDSAGSSHSVTDGESLWSITADLLGADASPADIAGAWPQLYRANADTIGTDPGVIHPDTLLTVPTFTDEPNS